MTEAEENKKKIWYHKNISKRIEFLGDIVPIRGGGGVDPPPAQKGRLFRKKCLFVFMYIFETI